jgi:hypothetical protein
VCHEGESIKNLTKSIASYFMKAITISEGISYPDSPNFKVLG